VRKKERRRRLRVAKREPPGAVSTPLEDVERAEKIASVRKALADLSERDRQMLLMREEGFRYAEIAEAIGVRSTSVGALLARALERFSAAWEAVGETDAAPR
jgi:RNA polymerase sigma-70 factor (ECF subfamily)